MQRQIVVDTETTGLEVDQGHRIIEIGCIELKNRRPTPNHFHRYVNPDREIDAGATQVHGITNEKVANEPKFALLAQELWDYLQGAELLIHNAAFDIGFLNAGFADAGITQKLQDVCTITDTVAMARKLHPGQKASLDALCKRYSVDNSNRDYHGALLDARLLADVYLAMTGGQSRLTLDAEQADGALRASRFVELLGVSTQPLTMIAPNTEELAAHQAWIKKISEKGKCLWVEEA